MMKAMPRVVSAEEWQKARQHVSTPRGETFGLSVFFRDRTSVYRSYFTAGRGVETLGPAWTFLDLTPLGRQEDWEDSPPGWPQTPPYQSAHHLLTRTGARNRPSELLDSVSCRVYDASFAPEPSRRHDTGTVARSVPCSYAFFQQPF
jgi:hypothetical protein